MVQIARPASDILTTNWTTTPLFSKLNDQSDATLVQNVAGTGNVAIVTLDTVTDPGGSSSGTDYVVKVHAQASGSGAAEKISVRLYEGSTIVSLPISGQAVSRAAQTEYSGALSAAEADSLSDFADLRIGVFMSTGGAAEFLLVAEAWLEIPDAAGAINGSGAATLAAIAASGTGDVDVEGSGAANLAAIASAGAGDVDVEGTGTADLEPIAASGTGTVGTPAVNGSGALDLEAISVASTGDVLVEASGALDLEPIVAAGTGTVLSPGINGSGTLDLRALAASGTADVDVEGTGAATLPPIAASGSGTVEIFAAGILVLPPIEASGSGGIPIEGGLAPFAIIGDTTRPEPWAETERPGRWDGTDRPSWWAEVERPIRWDATERPEPWVLSIRPSPFGESARPSFWAETVFVREDRAVALTMVAYGPFTENEIPEALLIRVMKPLKAGGTAPYVLFAQTPAYTAQVSIKDPVAAVVTRAAEIMDPADLPIDYPDDFSASEEGWVRVAWAATDFTAEGTYEVQVTLDNGVVLLKSTDVWQPEINVGPASAVV